VAKTNQRLDWCHKGETPPVLLQIEEAERQAAQGLAANAGDKGGGKKGKGKKNKKKTALTATKKRRLR
jgi:hypothetical protein